MAILKTLFVPHPPIIIEKIGGPEINQVERTRQSLFRLARELAADQPDTVLISSPHAAGGIECVGVLRGARLRGSFVEFGYPSLRYEFDNDEALVQELLADPALSKSLEEIHEVALDWGVLVFLDFVRREGYLPRIVVLSAVWGRKSFFWEFGQALGKFLARKEGRYVYVASGDLSHCTRNGPGRIRHDEGPLFDRKVVEAVANNDPQILLGLDNDFTNRAQQCGLCSFLVGFGVMASAAATGEVYSYEDPFGVGYLVGALKPGG